MHACNPLYPRTLSGRNKGEKQVIQYTEAEHKMVVLALQNAYGILDNIPCKKHSLQWEAWRSVRETLNHLYATKPLDDKVLLFRTD